MKSIFIAAALAALPLAANCATPFETATSPRYVQIAHGQSIQQAILQARFQTRVAALRQSHAMPDGSTAAREILPAITGGSVITSTLTVGQANSFAQVQVGYTTGRSGLAALSLQFTSPNGVESLSVDYSPLGFSRRDTVNVMQPGNVPNYAQPGQWALSGAYIEDFAGNFITYTQAQLAALFPVPYVTVVNNGPVDIAAPVVTSGKLLTPTVSMSSPQPSFQATLTGTDDVSGFEFPYVAIEAPGAGYSNVNYAPMPFPLLSGTATAYSSIFSTQPTGTWTITAYALCDVAGNCLQDGSAADIQTLFGTTTFQVTK